MGSSLSGAEVAEGDQFLVGPMAVIVDQVVEKRDGYSLLGTGYCGFVSEGRLGKRAKKLNVSKKGIGLPGLKRAKETRYYFNNARALSRIAMEVEKAQKDTVIAVLFRDSDGTASADRGRWDDQRESILQGFDEEGFTRGVPMLPKPKSEAWLLCAVKRDPYQGCGALEDESGNDGSPKSLKSQLAKACGSPPTRETLCEMLRNGTVDIDRIKMPSFTAFRDRLEQVL